MSRDLFIKLGALLLLLAGCANQYGASNSPGVMPENASAMLEVSAGEYRISPNDTLQINVFQVADLSRTVQVNGNGTVNLPLLGVVRLAGKTVDEAQNDLAGRLSKRYLQSPQVSITVVKSGQRVTVNGAVRSPNVLTIDGRLTLSQAIAQTGGMSELGNGERVHIARVSGSQVQDVVFNLEDIQAGRIPDPALRGGDIIVVEESGSKVALKNVKDLLPFAVLSTFLSDIRLKRDVQRVASTEQGVGLYRYRYLWSDTVHVGVMAQEVAEMVPDAVTRGPDGYLRVNYARLGVQMQTWAEWQAAACRG